MIYRRTRSPYEPRRLPRARWYAKKGVFVGPYMPHRIYRTPYKKDDK